MFRRLQLRPALFAAAMGLLGPVAVVMVGGAARSAQIQPYRADFAVYYGTSTIGLRYGFDHIYDEPYRIRIWNALAPELGGPLQRYPIVQPPTIALATVPFALIPIRLAYGIWLVLIFGALLAGWWLGAPGGRWARAGYLIALLALVPVGIGLYAGQLVFVVLAAVLATWRLLRRDHEVAAGLVLLLILLKPQTALLVPPILLVTGHHRAFAVWAAGAIVVGVVTTAVIGPDTLMIYAGRLGDVVRHPKTWDVVSGMTLPGEIGGAAGTVASIGVAAIALFGAWRKRRQGLELPLAIALVGSLIMSSYVHEADSVVLIPAAWLFISTQHSPWTAAFLVAGYVAIDLGQTAAVGWGPVLAMALVWFLAMAIWPSSGAGRPPSQPSVAARPHQVANGGLEVRAIDNGL
jgi:hypothetical protein